MPTRKIQHVDVNLNPNTSGTEGSIYGTIQKCVNTEKVGMVYCVALPAFGSGTGNIYLSGARGLLPLGTWTTTSVTRYPRSGIPEGSGADILSGCENYPMILCNGDQIFARASVASGTVNATVALIEY